MFGKLLGSEGIFAGLDEAVVDVDDDDEAEYDDDEDEGDEEEGSD